MEKRTIQPEQQWVVFRRIDSGYEYFSPDSIIERAMEGYALERRVLARTRSRPLADRRRRKG